MLLRLFSCRVQWFRGGLAFEAHRLLYHSTLGLRGEVGDACHAGPLVLLKKEKASINGSKGVPIFIGRAQYKRLDAPVLI